MSLETDANEVLRLLVNKPNAHKRVDYSSELEYHQNFLNFDYCLSVFKHLKDNFSEFINLLTGSGLYANVQMRIGRDNEINKFLEEGGCEEFKNYEAFKTFIKKQKEDNKPHIGDIIEIKVGDISQSTLLLGKHNKQVTVQEMNPNTINHPNVKSVGLFKKCINWCMNNIWNLIMGIAILVFGTYILKLLRII